MSTPRITIRSPHEKWRLVCDEGHTNWFPIDGHFRCQQCARLRLHDPEVDAEKWTLWDKKEERHVTREQVELKIGDGPTRSPA